MFKIENLKYYYDDDKSTLVLDNINYQFNKGKLYAIVGKSGTGKTTLLSLMANLDKPKGGKILFKDIDISTINENKYRSQNIGVIFQSFNLLPHLTALENVILSMDISGIKCDNKKEKALNLLNSVGIDKTKANRKILRLSGGEQQKISIARALSYDPDLILADEPTGNLDSETEKQIIDIFKNLAKDKNKCVIIVTHSQNVASQVDEIIDLQEFKNKNKNKDKNTSKTTNKNINKNKSKKTK